jgi:hypothetical protein
MNVEENEINNRNSLIFTIITDLYRLKNSCKVFVTIAGDWQSFSRRQYLTIKYVFQVKCKCTVRVQLVIRRTLCPLTLITDNHLWLLTQLVPSTQNYLTNPILCVSLKLGIRASSKTDSYIWEERLNENIIQGFWF